jgi:hypothetical protein
MFTVLRWSPRVGIDLGKWSNIEAYLDRVAARPKVKQAEGLLQFCTDAIIRRLIRHCVPFCARRFPCVNADLIFPKSAEVKFPSLAGMVINRSRDRRLHFLAADHAGAGSAV